MNSKTLISEGIAISTFDREDVLKSTYETLIKAENPCYLKDNMIVQKMEGLNQEQILELALKQLKDTEKSYGNLVKIKTNITRIK